MFIQNPEWQFLLLNGRVSVSVAMATDKNERRLDAWKVIKVWPTVWAKSFAIIKCIHNVDWTRLCNPLRQTALATPLSKANYRRFNFNDDERHSSFKSDDDNKWTSSPRSTSIELGRSQRARRQMCRKNQVDSTAAVCWIDLFVVYRRNNWRPPDSLCTICQSARLHASSWT